GASGLIANNGNYLILGGNIKHPSGLFNQAGDMQLVRLDPLGNLLYPSKILGQDVGETATWIDKATDCAGAQGYIIAGNEFNGGNNNMLLTLTDGGGNPLWVRRIGTPNTDEKSACVKTDGGGNFILVGTKTNTGTGASAIHAVKTDCAGNLLWERVYSLGVAATATSVTAFATFQTACLNLPNEYFITGKTSAVAGGNEEVFILSVNASTGSVSWMKTYDIAPNADDVGTCIQGNCNTPAPPSGSLWVSGYSLETSGSAPRKVLAMQTDISGNLFWANNYDIQNSDQELSTHFQFAANNKLVLTGKAEDPGVSDPPEIGQCMLMRINDNGSSVDWTRVYQMGFASQGNRVEPNAGDEYFITGHTYEIIQPHVFDYNILAIKTNKIGQTDSECHHSPETIIIPRQPITKPVQPTPNIPQDFFPTSLATVLYDDKQTFCHNSTPIDPCDTLGLNANFTYSVSGNTVTFTDLSTIGSGSIFSWSWDFGDANTSNLQNPTHTYSSPGGYVVCLIVAGGNAGALCRDTICFDIVIHDTPTDPCDSIGLVANFSASVSGNTVTFTDLSTIVSGTIFSWSWSFGDAGTSFVQNPTHTYSNTGVYTVCLVVDAYGTNSATMMCSDTICMEVVIDHLTDGCLCDSTFFAAVGAGFTTTGTNPVGFTPVALDTCDRVLWLWGDGSPNSNSVANATVFHTYAIGGTYFVCMVVTRISIDGQICTREFCKQIQVSDPKLCVDNIVKNGDFTAGLVPGNLGSPGNVNNWTTWTNTPQVIIGDTCQEAGAIQMWGNQVVGESIQQPVAFTMGGIYEVTFCGKWLNTVQDSVRFRFRASTGLPGSYLNCSGTCDEISLSPVLTTNWVTYTSAPWTATQNFNTLTISVWNNYNINDGAYVSWSRLDDVCIRRIGTSATKDIPGQVSATLFPNPTSGELTLEFGQPLESEAQISILDLTGRTVQQITVGAGQIRQTLSISHSLAGIYLVQAMSDGKPIWTGKVVKE
ncbi:MAG: PKD domain-containing protein, partial [Phycisphaerae bacterium]|nr:PKD domain-containing protein [Saprospiraceae bacterium]